MWFFPHSDSKFWQDKGHQKELVGLVSGVECDLPGNDYEDSYNKEPPWYVREHTKSKQAGKGPQITLIPTGALNSHVKQVVSEAI